MDNRMKKQNNNRTHYDKTENNKTDQDVSEEYRKHVKKKKKIRMMRKISLETRVNLYADILMNNTLQLTSN